MTTTASLPPESIDATLRDHLRRSWSDPCYINDHVLCRSPYWHPETDRGVTRRPFHIPNGPHVQALFKELGELRYRLKAKRSRRTGSKSGVAAQASASRLRSSS